MTLTFDLLTLKVVYESRVTWATSVTILVFLAPLCSRLRSDVRDRLTSDAHHFIMPRPYGVGGVIIGVNVFKKLTVKPSLMATVIAVKPQIAMTRDKSRDRPNAIVTTATRLGLDGRSTDVIHSARLHVAAVTPTCFIKTKVFVFREN